MGWLSDLFDFSSRWIEDADASTFQLLDTSEEFKSSLQTLIDIAIVTKGMSVADAIKLSTFQGRNTDILDYVRNSRDEYQFYRPTVDLGGTIREEYLTSTTFAQFSGGNVISIEEYPLTDEIYRETHCLNQIGFIPYKIHGISLTPSNAIQCYYFATEADHQNEVYSRVWLTHPYPHPGVGDNEIIVKYQHPVSGYYFYRYMAWTQEQYDSHFTTVYEDPFPVLPVKIDHTYIDHDSYKSLFASTQNQLDFLGLNVQEIIDQLRESEIPFTNEQQYRMTDAFLYHGAHLYTSSQAGLKYLHELFKSLLPTDEAEHTQYINITEQQYSFRLTYKGRYRNWGSPPASYLANIANEGYSSYWDGTFFNIVHKPDPNDNRCYWITLREVQAVTYTNTSENQNFLIRIPFTQDTGNTAYDNMRIPIDYEVLSLLDLDEQEQFIREALCVSMHHVQGYWESWGERNADKLGKIIQVIAIILAIPSGGASLSWATVASFAQNMIIAHVLKTVIASSVSDPVLQAILMAGVDFLVFGSFGSEATIQQNIGTVLNSVGAAGNQYLKLEFASLEAEIEAFTMSAEEMREEIENAEDLLAPSPFGDALLFSKMNLPHIGESPDMFYSRSLRKNPGADVINSIHSYHASKLALPKVAPMNGAQYSHLAI